MSYLIPFVIGILLLLVKLLPVIFLLVAAIVVARAYRTRGAKFLAVGAVLLGLGSLNSAFNFFGAYLLDGKTLAGVILYTSIAFEIVNFAALVLIGLGLVRVARSPAPPALIERA